MSERRWPTIQSQWLMITVAWNTAGFHVTATLLKDTKFNNAYHIIEILGNIKKLWETHGTARTRKLIVYADNAWSYTAKTSLKFLMLNEMVKALYPPYSSDLTPSNFYIFVNVKIQFNGSAFDTSDDLLLVIEMILNDLEKMILIRVFHNWMKRLQKMDWHKRRVYYMTYKLNAHCNDFCLVDLEMFMRARTS
jgi:hypothetical protein